MYSCSFKFFLFCWFVAVLSSKVLEIGTEVDKVLLHLEVKEFTVEASTLITVQHLIQWTVTFILKLLNNLSDWRTTTAARGTMVIAFDLSYPTFVKPSLVLV